MKVAYKGLFLAALHVALVSSLGAKLLYDRAHRPRVWIKVAPRDPDMPIRGRYLSLSIEVPTEGFTFRSQPSYYLKDKDGKPVMEEVITPMRCSLVLRNGELTAVAREDGDFWIGMRRRQEVSTVVVNSQTVYFIPEHASDPSRRVAGEELWMEATIPRKGPPRPIRLGVKKNGVLTPLAID
jgi:hypothetical protein